MEKLFNAGYFEGDIATGLVYYSSNFLKLLNIPEDKFRGNIEDIESVRNEVLDLVGKEGIHQITFRHKFYTESPLNFRFYLPDGNKIIGTVFPA